MGWKSSLLRSINGLYVQVSGVLKPRTIRVCSAADADADAGSAGHHAGSGNAVIVRVRGTREVSDKRSSKKNLPQTQAGCQTTAIVYTRMHEVLTRTPTYRLLPWPHSQSARALTIPEDSSPINTPINQWYVMSDSYSRKPFFVFGGNAQVFIFRTHQRNNSTN
jgi:hypothetical protein